MLSYFYYLAILVMTHAVGDYALQSDYIAKGKQTSLYVLFIHVNIWTYIIVATTLFLGTPVKLGLIVVCLWVPHFIMDYLKAQSAWFLKTVPNQKTQLIIDQTVHYLQIAVFVWFATH